MGKRLDQIQDPAELENLSIDELYILAEELRQTIIERVSKNGGHLSSNLGVVELTLALVQTFNFKEDQIVWDVGHQCYAYKLLTGRYNEFSTLRQYEGLAGFPRRSESEYDFFDTGHSSTSISAALGLLRAKHLKGESGRVIAVIGDGALTNGMAYEALNDAGQFRENLIVILNDNQMSIDQNVGGISRHLASARSSARYIRAKRRAEKFMKKIPVLGSLTYRFLAFMKDTLRIALRRKHPVIFEDLGFRYYGPIDGHDLPTLLRFLKTVEDINEPVLLHVCTQKGKGYDYAEAMPSQYHGVAPFDTEAGCKAVSGSSFTSAFGETLVELAAEEPKVVAICAAMMTSTGLDLFRAHYKRRFFDVGIAEGHCITMAAGMAANGLIPVVALYSTFLQRGFDQLLHDVALQNLHVVFAIDRAGIVGPDGETHQGIYDLPILLAMPGFTVFAPRDYGELKLMLRYAILENKGPVAIRYPRASEVDLGVLPSIPVTKAQYLHKGSDITILTVGFMAAEVMKSVSLLEQQGISATVLDLRCLKPLDEETILEAIAHRPVLVCEEGMFNEGVGAAVSLLLHKHNLKTDIAFIGIDDHPVPAGTRAELFHKEGLDAEAISQACLKLLRKDQCYEKEAAVG